MKFIMMICLTFFSLFGTVKNSYPTVDITKKMKVIDIRTPNEWKTTGIVHGSYPITFFDEQGRYDISSFMAKLSKVVKKGESVGIICNSGNRSIPVSDFLDKQGYTVTNLQGGIIYLLNQGIKFKPYP